MMLWLKPIHPLVWSHWLTSMRPVLSIFFFLVVLLASNHAFAVVGAAPNPTIQNLPANTWYEVPDSKMEQVEAKEADFPGIWVGNFRGADGVFPWSGGIFDDKRNRLVLWGGGHNDYYGNELYAFDLTTFKWERLTDPSPPTTPDICRTLLSDGNPNSRHTYYNLAYLPPPTDKFFSTPGGTTSCNASGPDRNTWAFDFDTKKWINLQPGNSISEQPPSWVAPTTSAYNPLDNKVYTTGPTGLFAYDVAENLWEKLNSVEIWLDRGAVVDTKRGLLVVIGKPPKDKPEDKGVIIYDLKNQNYAPQYWDTFGGEFIVENQEYEEEIRTRYRPGVNYDPVADRIIIWDGGAVRALNMDTKHWDVLSAPDQKPSLTGTYGRFRYSSRENAYVLVNGAKKNVLIYKLADNTAALNIIAQPSAVVVDQGQTARFSVLAVGSGVLDYQWRKNGIAITGATADSYSFTASDMVDNNAMFDVVVSNAVDSVTSSGAALTIIADTIAPTVDAVGALGPNRVQVVFSEPVTRVSAEDAGHYVFSPTTSVSDASLGNNGQVVLLTVPGLGEGVSYSLTLNGIVDRAPVPNTIVADTRVNFVYRASEGFEDGNAAGFEPQTPSRWEVVQDDGDYAYSLNTTDFDTPGNGLLGEYSLLPGVYGDVVFSLNARLGDDVASNGLADLALLFGYQDANNYYYLMLNNAMAETKLFKVESGSRSELAEATTDWLNDNAYHAIQIVRNGHQIRATIDGNVLFSATDTTFALGRLGVGSFNDSAYFDDVSVTGVTSALPDNVAPVITLTGADPQELTVGTVYTELGAMAQDNVDGDITANIVIDFSAVDVTSTGSYSVTYNVSDVAENAANEVSRTVNVVAATGNDNIAPVITLTGANPQELTVGTAYAELGAMAQDNVDGDITANIVIDFSAVDVTSTGSYSVTYNVSDVAENAANEVSRTVNVVAASTEPNGGSGSLGWWMLAFIVVFAFVKRSNATGICVATALSG